MLRDRKIAVFIDVDNSALDCDSYEKVMEQICEMGEIVCGTIYGASERKHKKVIEQGLGKGYAIQQPMRNRRRVRKVFDDRIFVDVATLVACNKEVDAVAVVSAPADLVYLFAYLRRLGLQVIAGDNLDEQSAALANAVVVLGKNEKPAVKATPKKAPKKPAVKVVSAEEPVSDSAEDRTEALLREINRLRADYDAGKATSQPVERQSQPAEQPKPDIVAETQNLRDQMASLQEEHKEAEPTPEVVAPKVEQAQPKEETPRATYVSQNDSDLIKRIEQLRNSGNNDSDDMVAEIKKLLDGLE